MFFIKKIMEFDRDFTIAIRCDADHQFLVVVTARGDDVASGCNKDLDLAAKDAYESLVGSLYDD